jgi:hypothetical protein
MNADLRLRVATGARLFHILPNGDPFSSGWEVHEYRQSFEEITCVYRGDISGLYGRNGLRVYLRRNYPGCIIREER